MVFLVTFALEAVGTVTGLIFGTYTYGRTLARDVARLEGQVPPLLEAAPSECVARTTTATRDAPAIAGDYPLVLYTHCYTCTRWSAHAVIERLVSEGFVVVSADHEGDTLFDALAGTQSDLTNELVDVRETDVRVLLDQVLDGGVLPEGVAAIPSQVGLLGHSIGSVTAGRVAQNDMRITAVLGMAAPMENILYGEVSMENIEIPVGMIEATEDNSIGAIGNTPLIRLQRASEATGCEILGKAEFLNPGGSVKDRVAKAIIEAAEQEGALKPGMTILDVGCATGFFSLALAIAAKNAIDGRRREGKHDALPRRSRLVNR